MGMFGPGRLVSSRYLLEELLGRGGMGEVWRAWDNQIGRGVALKLMLDLDPRGFEMFQSEVRTLGSLSHSGIVTCYDTGVCLTDDGAARPYMVMELVDGVTVDWIIDRVELELTEIAQGRRAADDRTFGPHTVAVFGAEVLASLGHAHEVGIVHRDIKPSNLMLRTGSGGDRQHAVVMDFGIARMAAKHPTRLTAIGTPAYMAPEQLAGIGNLDGRADIFSLGLVLIGCIVGRTNAQLGRLEGVPAPLRPVLARMVQKDPSHRYPDAKSCAGELIRAGREANRQHSAESNPQRPFKPKGTRRQEDATAQTAPPREQQSFTVPNAVPSGFTPSDTWQPDALKKDRRSQPKRRASTREHVAGHVESIAVVSLVAGLSWLLGWGAWWFGHGVAYLVNPGDGAWVFILGCLQAFVLWFFAYIAWALSEDYPYARFFSLTALAAGTWLGWSSQGPEHLARIPTEGLALSVDAHFGAVLTLAILTVPAIWIAVVLEDR